MHPLNPWQMIQIVEPKTGELFMSVKLRSHYRLIPSLLLFVVLTISSCAAINQNSQTPSQTETATTSEATRIISHAMGTTKINGTPQRIVVLTNEATDIVLALGIKPIGAVKSWQGDPYYDYIQAEMAGVPVVGDEFQPNLERIVALNPDLIIGSKVRQEQTYSQLSAIAPTVFSETIGVSWKDNLKLYAEALNREENAKKILADWDRRVAEFKTKLGNKQSLEVSLIRFLPGMARIYYNDSFPGQIIEEVGLQRPDSQDKDKFAAEVGLEDIPELDGDILFYFTYTEGERKTAIAQEWLNHPLWQSLEVVRNDKVYRVNDVFWTTSGGVQAANKVLDDLHEYLLDEWDG
jgi:iron complex transport system substrate-binding protein